MSFLSRESAPFEKSLWEQIDEVVIDTAKKNMVCRRFLDIYGPLGAGTSTVPVDSPAKTEELEEGFGHIAGRKNAELPMLYEDFSLLWRDLEEARQLGLPADLSEAAAAARRCARKEDDLILSGSKKLGTPGLAEADGAHIIERGNWREGENAYQDVARALSYFSGNSMIGRYALLLSPEIWMDLQRLQPNLGILEADRIAKLVDGRMYSIGPYGAGKAVLVCAEPDYMDLAVGLDLSVAYLEQKDMNHELRVLETAALRIKNPAAIVVFR